MKSVTLSLRISEELMTELESEADRRDVAVSVVARELLDRIREGRYVEVSSERSNIVSHITEKTKEGFTIEGLEPGDYTFVMEKPCPHPKNRRAQTAKGKRCLDCGANL